MAILALGESPHSHDKDIEIFCANDHSKPDSL